MKTDIDVRLVQNFKDLIVLAFLKTHSSVTGYEVIRHFHRRYHILVSSGTVYSLLYLLERQGLVEGFSNGRRRTYRLTMQGEEFLDQACASFRRNCAVCSSIFSSV